MQDVPISSGIYESAGCYGKGCVFGIKTAINTIFVSNDINVTTQVNLTVLYILLFVF